MNTVIMSQPLSKDALLKHSSDLARCSVTRLPLIETNLIES
jgi:hypothetical protein